jgi:LysM domain
LFTRLKRCAYAPIVALALWAVVLAVSPATATAKATPQAKDPQVTDRAAGATERVVVAPGDSLWSISAQWLGPDSTTQQIADGVDRIYTLNQNQIGSSLNLIFAGQILLLPSDVERQSPDPARAESARHAGELMAPSPPLRAANNGSDTAAGAEVSEASEADHKARHAPEVRFQPTSLPEPARAVPVSAVRSLAPNDSPPSLEQSVTSKARSVFSAVVATVGEALSFGSYSGRKLLGGAVLAMSTVLAFILALHVAREVWGPSHARRQARERWVREALGRNYSSPGTFDTRYTCAAASVAFERRPSEGSPMKEENPTPMAEGPRTRAPAGHSANGSASSDDVRKMARLKQVRMRQTRPLKAKRPPRGRAKDTAGGLRPGQARRRLVTRAQRTLSLRRKGGRIVGTEPTELDPMQEWKIGEPLRRAIGGIPVQPGAPVRDALLEVKPLAADALTTVALLEQRRGLSDKEQRQARALHRFLAKIEEVCGDERLR